MRYQRLSARLRGYDSRWDKARLTFLRRHPLCAMCLVQGHLEQATVVDHIVPHKGERALFWASSNWQPLCKIHHDAAKQAEDRQGYSGAVGLDGWPTDARHPANKKPSAQARGG